jgi:hypothetical protein
MWYSKENIGLIWLKKRNAGFMSNRLRILESMWYSKENIKLIHFKNRNDKLMSIHMRILEFIGTEENIGLVGFLLENFGK